MSANQPLYDVVIFGAGAAGITIALQLSEAGLTVALVEGGDFDLNDFSQSLYQGYNTALDYPMDAQRLRFFGGTTNHWAGWCRPLDPETFIPRPDINYEGWSIDRSELDAHLESALEILDIEPTVDWYPSEEQQETTFNRYLTDASFKEVYWHWSEPTRFKLKYFAELDNDPNITISLKDSLVDFEYTPEGDITGAILRNYETQETRTIRGKQYVMACGAIENARLLLHVNAQNGTDFGNQSGHLGKHFMEHPHIFDVGKIIFLDQGYDHVTSGGRYAFRFFCLDDKTTKADQIMRAILRVRVIEVQGIQHQLIDEVNNRTNLDLPKTLFTGNIDITTEQFPTITNTITLSDEVDALGIGKTVLNWDLAEIDIETMRQTLVRFAQFMAHYDLGRCKLVPWATDKNLKPRVVGGGHHMGTTRMSNDSSTGVVDINSRVYGTKNLYMAGSSVFPTGGYTNPTLTIVQLALRLADHIITRFDT